MLPEKICLKTNVLLEIALSPPGAFFIGGITVLLFRQWPTDNAAAWVQAVGSIGAIVGAFLVANRTQRLVQREARDAELGVEIKAVLLAEGIVKEATETFVAVCKNVNNFAETGVSFRRMESVHQALMLAISQPISEQALEPALKTLQSVSNSCGILQDAMTHSGVLRQQDRERLHRHKDSVKENLDVLSEVLKDIRARRARSK